MVARTRFVALVLYGLLWVHPQPASGQAWAGTPDVFTETETIGTRPAAPGDGRLSADATSPLAWLDRQCQEPGFSWRDEGADMSTTLWGSPVKLTWRRIDSVHYVTGLDTSYALPQEDIHPGPQSYLRGDRFRAWLRSGVQWQYAQDSVLSVDTRWSIAGLDGIEPAAPFHAAATVTVTW